MRLTRAQLNFGLTGGTVLFHSPGFLFVLLPLFLITMAFVRRGLLRRLVLLGFSYLFYSGGEPFFVLLLLVSSLTDYAAALRIDSARSARTRLGWLLVSIFVNLALLGFYKYGGWVLPYIAPVLEAVSIPTPRSEFFAGFLLPAGISFYTFQSMSYSIDVYRRDVAPERNLIGFLNYVAYLPQLIAGPIERFRDLAPQLQSVCEGKGRSSLSAGLDRVFLGIIQKLLIADPCGLIADRVFATSGPYEMATAWCGTLAFGMQIFFDFSAYTSMAIGIALMTGVRLRENFLAPYSAASIQDFWRRWHVTLSQWFRDYVYIPLGGSRGGSRRTAANLMVTFLLCGLWHGAGWNYVAWGALHGAMLTVYNTKKLLYPGVTIPRPLAIALTFVAVHFAWVPFRIGDPDQVLRVWRGMLGLEDVGRPIGEFDLLFVAIVVLGTLILPTAAQRCPGRSGWAESIAYAAASLTAILITPNITRFIYFQF